MWFIVKNKLKYWATGWQSIKRHLFNTGTDTPFSSISSSISFKQRQMWNQSELWIQNDKIEMFQVRRLKCVMEVPQDEWRAPAAKPLCKFPATLFDKQQHRFVYMQSLARHCAHSPAVRAESCQSGDTQWMTPVCNEATRPDITLHSDRHTQTLAEVITCSTHRLSGVKRGRTLRSPSAPQTLGNESEVE